MYFLWSGQVMGGLVYEEDDVGCRRRDCKCPAIITVRTVHGDPAWSLTVASVTAATTFSCTARHVRSFTAANVTVVTAVSLVMRTEDKGGNID